MNLNELLTLSEPSTHNLSSRTLSEDAMLTKVLAAIADSESGRVPVKMSDNTTQYITAGQMATAMATILPYSTDSSEIQVVCHPSQYSASSIARAVEDADAAMLSLLSYPGEGDSLNVYIRTNRADPSPVVHSLERYGYSVSDANGTEYTDARISSQRLYELQHYLNI